MSSSATNENLLFDVVVVGGGVVGLATCRFAALQGYKVACIEKEADLCHWASGSNSGIVCTGVDAAEGSLERSLIRDSIAQLRTFCREMNLPTRPCGSLVCRWPWDDDDGNNDSAALRRVLMESHDAGDTHASFLTPDQVAVKEPHLNSACLGAVHIPGEVVVDPWLCGIAYAIHARQNGAKIYTKYELDTKTSSFDTETKIWTLRRKTGDGDSTAPQQLKARAVVNATGLWADLVQRGIMIADDKNNDDVQWEARPRRGQYRIFQSTSIRNLLTHPIQPFPTDRTKGIFVFSTLYDQIVVGPTATDQESRTDRTIDTNVIDELTATVQRILPDVATGSTIVVGDYVGIRPGTNHRDYQIHLRPEKHWLVCAGIRSTGLTASLGIGRHVVQTLQSSGILPKISPRKTIKTIPLPPVGELAKSYRASGKEESVTIHGFLYKVTHPLTRHGFAAGSGIANASATDNLSRL